MSYIEVFTYLNQVEITEAGMNHQSLKWLSQLSRSLRKEQIRLQTKEISISNKPFVQQRMKRQILLFIPQGGQLKGQGCKFAKQVNCESTLSIKRKRIEEENTQFYNAVYESKQKQHQPLEVENEDYLDNICAVKHANPFVLKESGELEQVDRYLIIEKIGEGSSGQVYKAITADGLNPNEFFAIKQLKSRRRYHRLQPDSIFPREVKNFMILQKFNQCTNIVQCMEILQHQKVTKNQRNIVDEDRLFFLVMEYCEQSLADLLKNNHQLTEVETRNYIKQLAKGLKFFQNLNIIHRDIKPANLLIKYDSEQNKKILKIADFGLAKDIKNSLAKSYCGTQSYMPYEVIKRGFQNQQSDI